jgi:hypothetical protein
MCTVIDMVWLYRAFISVKKEGGILHVHIITTCLRGAYGLAISLAYPIGEEGGIFLVQMISTCLRGTGEGGGDLHPVVRWESGSNGPALGGGSVSDSGSAKVTYKKVK